MNRQQKELVVSSLRDSFLQNKAAFVVGFKGLTVSQMRSLRGELRQHGGTLKVAKASLMRRAIVEIDGVNELSPFLKEQIGIVFSAKDSSAVAKALQAFAKANPSLHLVVGCMDSMLLDKSSVERIASLPSREVMLAIACGTIKAPITGLVGTLSMLTMRLLWTLKQIETKKQ